MPKKDGFFVEVGASDGVTFSNTSQLVSIGWSGVYIEPVFTYYKKCVKNYEGNKGITILNIACSDHTGTLKLFEGPNIFTANNRMIKSNSKSIIVPCLTLNNIFSLLNRDVDLLVIDAEFHEREVLKGFDLKKYDPGMVIIEVHEKNTNKKFRKNVDFINEYFNEYKKIYSDTINNIYIK